MRRLLGRIGATRAGVWLIGSVIAPIDARLARVSRGRWTGTARFVGPVLLLVATGRRTGRRRTTPLFYVRDGERLVVCNADPGFERVNPWVLNVRARPEVWVRIGRREGAYRAVELLGAAVEMYWPAFVRIWPAYARHFERTGRRALFALDPVEIDAGRSAEGPRREAMADGRTELPDRVG